ncbi:uncharacterized protein O3C94_021879, partial [Discoglossus pictus]
MWMGDRHTSMSQIRLQCTEHSLKRRQQNRERQAKLYDQWEEICRKQQEARARNRNLLRDFRRVERELSLLAAKTDSFRRKRDEYKKELQRILSLQPSSD